MLDGLDDRDWHGLSHAYGPADDVPDTLRALAEGKTSAEDAAGVFWGNIWHQGTVYEATAYAVPFLLQLLQEERIVDREWLLLLLNSLASGSSYLDVHGAMPGQTDREFQAARQQEIAWVRAAHQATAAGIPVYLALLQSRRPQIRTAASYTLSIFPERAEEILPRLRRSLPGEPRRDVQASLLLCLGALGDREADTGRVLEEATRRRRDDPRRLAAALGLLWRDKAEAAPLAVRAVQDVLADPEMFPEAYVFSAWDIDADPGQTLYEALLLLGQEKAVSALLDVLGRAEEPADILIDTLVEAGFQDREGVAVAPAALTAAQRRILVALLETKLAWDNKGNWRLGFVPGQYGLPEHKEDVERLLKAKDA
jgi:hypothetical protein